MHDILCIISSVCVSWEALPCDNDQVFNISSIEFLNFDQMLYILYILCIYTIYISSAMVGFTPYNAEQPLLGIEFFYLLLACPTANFEPLSKGQPH